MVNIQTLSDTFWLLFSYLNGSRLCHFHMNNFGKNENDINYLPMGIYIAADTDTVLFL